MINKINDVKIFDISSIKPYSNILIIGKNSYEKSQFVEQCLVEINKKEPFDFVNIWSHWLYPQIPTNLQYKEYYEEKDKESLDRFINIQNDYYIKNYKKRHGLLIFDNKSKHNYNKDKSVINYILNQNIIGNTIIYTTKTGSELSKSIIDNFDYIFSFKNMKINKQQKLYQNFFNIIDNFSFFRDIFIYYTLTPNTFIVYENINNTIYHGIFNYNDSIKNYRCSLKKSYWIFDKIITEKYNQYKQYTKDNENNEDNKDNEDNEDNKVKILIPTYYNYQNRIKSKKNKFKKPKYYPHELITHDLIEIDPPLD